MNDITDYTDDELALIVFNDERLYLNCCGIYGLKDIRNYLSGMFQFTDAQWAILVERLEIIDATSDYEQFATWPKGGNNE